MLSQEILMTSNANFMEKMKYIHVENDLTPKLRGIVVWF